MSYTYPHGREIFYRAPTLGEELEAICKVLGKENHESNKKTPNTIMKEILSSEQNGKFHGV